MKPFLLLALPLVVLFVYGVLAAFLLYTASRSDRVVARRVPLLGFAALLLHGVWLLSISVWQGGVPVASVGQALATFGLFIWAGERAVNPRRAAGGSLIAGLAAWLTVALSLLVGFEPEPGFTSGAAFSGLHIFLTVAGSALLITGATFGLDFILLDRQMQSGRLDRFGLSLPPLETLARRQRLLTGAGLLLLAGGSAAGLVWGDSGGARLSFHALPAWLAGGWFLALNVALWLRRRPGRLLAWLNLAGGALVAAVLVSALLMRGGGP